MPPGIHSLACQSPARTSQRIGSDPLPIQAMGGNTSIKDRDRLWIKASVQCLRDALRRPLFVALPLSQLRARTAAGQADPMGPALLPQQAEPAPRPR